MKYVTRTPTKTISRKRIEEFYTMGSGNNKPIQIQDDNRETFSVFPFENCFNTMEDNHETNDENLETFSLLWLDSQVNTLAENRQTQLELRQIINHLKIFDDKQQCYQYIRSLSSQDRLILIISDKYGRQLIPQIHQLRQVSSIYVYGRDKKVDEQWTNDFIKIKGVIVRVDDLINEIKIDQKYRAKIDEPLSMNISTVGHSSHEPTNGFNSRFVHSLLFIDALIRMKSIDNDKQQLITLCNNEYENNATQLSLVREFEKEYSADKALWWYTRDSFLYRMLNKALRIQNIDLLILFHSLIVDIYHQLKENQCLSPIHVYRGHVISDDELNTLRESIGKFIFINSFLSTSTNHHAVLGFLRDCNILDGLHRVLFEIDADPGVITSRPFANISGFSDFEDEDEVLFMVGSVFRLVDINRDDDEQLWLVRIKLCGDDEYKLNEIFDDLRKEYGGDGNEINLRFFGDVLRQMGKHDQAEKTYHRLLNELPANDPSIVHLYRSFGILYRTKGEYDSSLQWFHKALTIQTQRYSSNYADIGDLYKWIGFVYSDKNNHDKALEYYSKAVEFLNQSSDQNQLDIAHIYNNMGIIYKQQEKYVEALDFYQSSLTIKQDCLPAHHSSIAMSHNNIGNVHLALGQYNLAMYHHELSLNIRLTSLPPQHPDIAMSYRNIALVYENKCEWEQALIYYEKSATIYRHLFPSQHPNISRIESDIQRVS